jgi:hypothetical protein
MDGRARHLLRLARDREAMMMTMKMSFTQWRKSRVWHDDLSKARLPFPVTGPGFVYDGFHVIEKTGAGYEVSYGQIGQTFSNIARAEKFLWAILQDMT